MRNGVVLGAVDEALFLLFHQALSQHGLCDADHFSFQLVIVDHLLIGDVPQDGLLPFLPDNLHCVQDWALGVINVLGFRQRIVFRHGFPPMVNTCTDTEKAAYIKYY